MALNHKSLQLRIGAYRTERKLSQQALADMIPITREYLAQIETGKRTPSLDTFVSIANALGVSADDLLVDSLEHIQATAAAELGNLLLDCNATEKQLLIEVIEYIKTVLHKLNI